jgi:hypothetical protein
MQESLDCHTILYKPIPHTRISRPSCASDVRTVKEKRRWRKRSAKERHSNALWYYTCMLIIYRCCRIVVIFMCHKSNLRRLVPAHPSNTRVNIMICHRNFNSNLVISNRCDVSVHQTRRRSKGFRERSSVP